MPRGIAPVSERMSECPKGEWLTHRLTDSGSGRVFCLTSGLPRKLRLSDWNKAQNSSMSFYWGTCKQGLVTFLQLLSTMPGRTRAVSDSPKCPFSRERTKDSVSNFHNRFHSSDSLDILISRFTWKSSNSMWILRSDMIYYRYFDLDWQETVMKLV